jgi:hypothetical protein
MVGETSSLGMGPLAQEYRAPRIAPRIFKATDAGRESE